MGSNCSCGIPSSTCISRMQESAQRRKRHRCLCRRPKCLMIRRRMANKCTCPVQQCCSEISTPTPHTLSPVRCPASCPDSPEGTPPKNLCRFTVDAYFT
ncbi:uncharacterized protein LOC142983270 [Anticarsia gemmatalis]|uniref:uncharacterized protein LOC142983270 n=1 Tax=Anticarsia gemmatalis TaxID=129554 RepID=UPI003F766472